MSSHSSRQDIIATGTKSGTLPQTLRDTLMGTVTPADIHTAPSEPIMVPARHTRMTGNSTPHCQNDTQSYRCSPIHVHHMRTLPVSVTRDHTPPCRLTCHGIAVGCAHTRHTAHPHICTHGRLDRHSCLLKAHISSQSDPLTGCPVPWSRLLSVGMLGPDLHA